MNQMTVMMRMMMKMILMKTLMKMNYWRKFVGCSWTMKKQELPDLVNLLVLGNKLFTITSHLCTFLNKVRTEKVHYLILT